MDQEVILSVLTPAVPSRWRQIQDLSANLLKQIGDGPAEHLILVDNKRRTVGEKRDALLRAAKGRYVAFVDDDDDVAPCYVARILEAAKTDPDVITFDQHSNVEGLIAVINFRLGNPNEPFRGIRPTGDGAPLPTVKRGAWHVCAWRRSIAIQSSFPRSNYGEDLAFCAPLWTIPCLREVHIGEILHAYRHSSKTTEAPPPG